MTDDVSRAPTGAKASDRGVGAPSQLLTHGLKMFAAPTGAPRARRATDLVLLVPALAGLALGIAAYPPSGVEASLERFLATIPHWLDPVWGFMADFVWLYAVALVLAAVVGRRLLVVAQSVGAVVAAAVVALVSTRLAIGAWPNVSDALFATSDAPPFPNARLAAAAAVIVVMSPHLTRPWRRAGRWVLFLGLVGALLFGPGTPVGTAAGVLIGIIAAAGLRLAAGTSAGLPGLDEIEAALAELGVAAHDLRIPERQLAGVFHVAGLDDRGRPLLVKVYGRDAYDTQVVSVLWRTLWYRDSDPILRGRLTAAEHEAFVTLLAEKGGLATREVVTAAETIDDDALLVLRGDAVSFAELGEEGVDAGRLREAWQALALLDGLKIAHRQIDPSTIVVADGRVGFADLGWATVKPTAAQLETDRAQLLASLAAVAGPEQAVGSAFDALGREGVSELLPYLQDAAFTPALRRHLDGARIDVDEVRKQAAARLDVEMPEPAKLRRVTWWSAAQLALLAFAAYTIVDAATGVDWGQVRSTLGDATWAWIVAGFAVAQLPRITQAISTLGSVPVSLPFAPVYALQLAMSYMNVAIPSGLARMAVSVRFFQRQGLAPPTAIASGTIDSFVGNVVQALLLGVLLVFSESTIALDLPVPSGDARILLWLLLGLVAATLALTLIRRLREQITSRVRRWWPDVRTALQGLRASHKLAQLLFGSLATELLFALALGLLARGLGYDISFAELLVINISVSLLASFVPIPGGVGVAEFGLTLGLTAAGMTAEPAIAAVLLYRISTFYLPPVWGFFAMRWLQRNRFL